MPLRDYLALRDTRPVADSAVLLDDGMRLAYLTAILQDGLLSPVSIAGSAGYAIQVQEYFAGLELIPAFAEKALETLRTHQPHNRTAVSPREPRFAIAFQVWEGKRDEVQPLRKGQYLAPIVHRGAMLMQRKIPVVGVLEMAAYVWDRPDAAHPERTLRDTSGVHVELAYVPGTLFDSPARCGTALDRLIMVNETLCSERELQTLQKLGMKRS